MRIDGVRIESMFGCVPSAVADNLSALAPLVGEEKAAAIVKATGFPVRRALPDRADVPELMLPAARRALEGVAPEEIGGVVAVSFSARERFPALASVLQHTLGLPTSTVAYDLSMACSGYVYGLFCAAQLVKSSGRKVLLVDGDVQSAWCDDRDANTLAVMSDGASATLLSPGEGEWEFSFFTDGAGGDALRCREKIAMDGFGVFRFVAGPVKRFLEGFVASTRFGEDRSGLWFAPHQANMYMVRQLAEALGLGSRTVSSGDRFGNTGSCSASLALADSGCRGPVLVAGFGAGLSAGAALLEIGDIRRGVVSVG